MNIQDKKRGLYWFRNDCRLTDMPALHSIANSVDSLLCVYVIDPEWFTPTEYGYPSMGKHRWSFICEGLFDLNEKLKAVGNRLHIIESDSFSAINSLIKEHNIDVLGTSAHHGYDERRILHTIARENPTTSMVLNTANTLFEESDFPFSLENMPDTFSPFRRKVEKYCEPRLPSNNIAKLPSSPLNTSNETWPSKVTRNTNSVDMSKLVGGETTAKTQLNYYLFETDNIASYKETRNGMLGWDYSSKLSAWLAAGHISPRSVLQQLKKYEKERTENDSTYWLFFELLWREFFYWQHIKHGKAFFAFDGIQKQRPKTGFSQDKFEQWVNGETGYEIVDACMKELSATGFMSNRGRQLVASCFVHELNLDWRYGAAYFEHQLIDYDVGSNYGNWQYLAGVGSDPRGHRQFNLSKQTQQYDANGAFRKRWLT